MYRKYMAWRLEQELGLSFNYLHALTRNLPVLSSYTIDMTDLQLVKSHLQQIYDSISYFQPLTARPPIIDSSFEAASESNEESQWLKQENIPGLKKLKENIGIDLVALDKVLLNRPLFINVKSLETSSIIFSSFLTILLVQIYLLYPQMLHTLLQYGMKSYVLQHRLSLSLKLSQSTTPRAPWMLHERKTLVL